MTIRLPILLFVFAFHAQPIAAADRTTRLDSELTPMGALRAGNAEHTIPAWDGGLTPERAPAGFTKGGRYADPFADEKPLFTIGRANASTYKASLTAGQLAQLETAPDSFALPVYPSHRSAAAPEAFYAGSRRNLGAALLADDGTPQHAVGGLPFPVVGDETDADLRMFWNQRLRWRGGDRDRIYQQASVSPTGSISLLRIHERAKFAAIDAAPSKAIGPVLAAILVGVIEPPRLSGGLKLIHETLVPPFKAWQRSPGPEFPELSRTTEAGNDTPTFGADGLLAEDQREGFAGGPERYQWKAMGKREIYVPYNAYRLHQAGLKPADLLTAQHLNPAYLRYELHRVIVLEARLKPGLPGAWSRRTFYIDEDSWQILLVDLYGRDDRIQRVQEVHTLMAYDRPLLLPAVETIYDLTGHRYLATGLDNDEREVDFSDIAAEDFTPGGARRWWRRGGAVPGK